MALALIVVPGARLQAPFDGDLLALAEELGADLGQPVPELTYTWSY